MAVKFRRKFTYSENSLEGEILLEGARIRVLFRFSPEKVAYVKSIKGARYDPDTKTWTIPREKYDELQKSRMFPEERFPRRFSELALSQSLEELAEIQKRAQECYQENPFSVDREHLAVLPIEVVFTLAKDSPQLRARVRFGSKATAMLTRMKGGHFLRGEGQFAVPAETLPALLSKLRDKKISFAVEADCGLHLKNTAELRKRLIAAPEKASPQELEEACLTPYVDFADSDSDLAFILKYATSRHLAALFPDDDNFHVRKKKSNALTEQELLRMMSRVQGLKYPLYLSRAVRSHLERRGLHNDEAIDAGSVQLSEEMLPFSKTPCAWVVLGEARAGLLIDEHLAKNFSINEFKYESFGKKRFYTAPESKLFDLYQQLNPSVSAKETEAFAQLLKDLSERHNNLKFNSEAKASVDAHLDPGVFSDPELCGKLFPHQRVAINWLAAREYSMLGDDMGLGKTLSVLGTIDLLLKSEKISFALIVCPNSLTRNWIREAKRFLPRRQFLALPESKSERGKLLIAIKRGLIPCNGLVLNYERMRLPDVHELLGAILSNHSALLCCDESQRVKNARSKTFMALQSLAPLCGRRICLTGTPTPRDITDIWAQVLVLDSGKRFGTNYVKWLKSVAELGNKYSDFAVRKFKAGSVQETISRVHELLLRRQKEEVMSLPEKTFIERDCKLSGTQAARYKEICEQLLLRIGTLHGGSFVKQIDNLLEEYLRAVQVASNPRLVDETWKGEPAKFLEIDEIVNEIVREQGGKIVIWTNFLGNVEELVARYADLGARPFSGKVSTAQRDATIQEFQNGDQVKILVAVPAAGGVGITLTAAQTAVYVDKSWNAEHWLQSVDRIHRIGQTGTVSITSLSACKIDELISKNLARKGFLQAKLLGDVIRNEDSTEEDYPSREELINALSQDDAPEEEGIEAKLAAN